jgi:hypothetical protein
MATAMWDGLGIFGDEVFTSTDLNRRSGEVLNHAREHPITISRNNEQFALLRREQAARLFGMANRITAVVELLSAVHSTIAGGKPSEPLGWLSIYDMDDLQKLFSEVLEATRKAATGICDWDNVAALIHEWHESALVAKDGVLDAAILEESDEQPLPHPEQVLRLEPEAERDFARRME